MKKLFALFTVVILFVAATPIYARESHAGSSPIGLKGGVSTVSRESHAGKPTNPGVSTGGSVGTMGSGSLLGNDTSLGGGSSFSSEPYLGQSPSMGGGSYSDGGYFPIFSPVRGFQWFFNIFLFGPSWFF